MKALKGFTLACASFLYVGHLDAQTSPLVPVTTFNYQGVARDANNAVYGNRTVAVRFTVLDGPGANALYSEQHTAMTSSLGLFTLEVGAGLHVGGTTDWGDIPWSVRRHYLKIEMDVEGGTNYSDIGESPILAVPIAIEAHVAEYARHSMDSLGGWRLDGNAGTDASKHFIGTTDDKPLKFRIYNVNAGFIGIFGNTSFGYRALEYNNQGNNTAFGSEALRFNTTGLHNTAVGTLALTNNTTGFENTASGRRALFSNTTGGANSAFGADAMHDNTTGLFNTACGFNALWSNTTGTSNTAIGTFTLWVNSIGAYNTAIGSGALFSNGGNDNTAIGHEALSGNSTGNSNVAIGTRALFQGLQKSNLVAIGDSALFNNGQGASPGEDATANTAIGSKALFANTIGAHNTATGSQALFSNTTGYNNTGIGAFTLMSNTNGENNTATGTSAMYMNTTGSYNTALGISALGSNISGGYNTAIGNTALVSNITGSHNIAIGSQALHDNTSGEFNVAIGSGAGGTRTDDLYSTFIGYYADASKGHRYNATAIGYAAIVDADNKTVIGNSSVTSIGGYAGWTTFPSDSRYKTNVRDDVQGLDFILKLKPVTYQLDLHLINENLNISESIHEQLDFQKESFRYTGFIAQEVEQSALEAGFDFSGVDKPQEEGGQYGLRYAEFVVPLVKAVQELSAENQKLRSRLVELEQLMEDLRRPK